MGRKKSSGDNALIVRRRKKILFRRVLLLFIFLISVLAMLCFKLPYFNVATIKAANNKIVSSDEIISLSGIYKGNNIFYINTGESIQGLLKNPYILSASIERKLPSTIIISVTEREAVYYGQRNGKFLVIDKNGTVLEERSDIKTMKLIRLDGFDYSKVKVGEILKSDDDRRLEFMAGLNDIIKVDDKFMSNIVSVDAGDLLGLKVYYGNFCIKLGTMDNLDKKLNSAANILDRDELKQAKGGYVDVSFNGNPVYYIEK
jgi:cell division protein FtsQ